MARKVYFSFYYDEDIIRVSQIRNSGVFGKEDTQPFLDKAEWESIQLDEKTILNWIEEQMSGTSVLVLCIGTNTYNRKWVRYEIKKAHTEKRGIIGLRIHQMRNFQSQTSAKGVNPLSTMFDTIDGREVCLDTLYYTYDWEDDNGREHIKDWIEKAAKQVGR